MRIRIDVDFIRRNLAARILGNVNAIFLPAKNVECKDEFYIRGLGCADVLSDRKITIKKT
ncbi:hypothetical protein [Nostoc sp.]|uniref:hypothetical protein n=1 Tax=Nostoc sp. TaxID=1180 RepID=UPI002FF5C9E1